MIIELEIALAKHMADLENMHDLFPEEIPERFIPIFENIERQIEYLENKIHEESVKIDMDEYDRLVKITDRDRLI